jgi:hypothetical protein
MFKWLHYFVYAQGYNREENLMQFVIHNTMFIISFHFLLHVSAIFPPLIRYKGKAIPVKAQRVPEG